jgi:hypothetical protein
MTFVRPLSLVVLLAVAIPIFAADNMGQSSTSSNSEDTAIANVPLYIAPLETLHPPSGLMLLEAHPSTLNHPPVPRMPLAKLDDGLCYTMRMYKVKRTESLPDDETGMRGYSTCELASNYQVRTAVAHVRQADSNK